MSNKVKFIELPESVMLTKNQVRKLLKVRVTVIQEMTKIGFLPCLKKGRTSYYNYYHVKQFAEDLFTNNKKLAKTREQRQFLDNNYTFDVE